MHGGGHPRVRHRPTQRLLRHRQRVRQVGECRAFERRHARLVCRGPIWPGCGDCIQLETYSTHSPPALTWAPPSSRYDDEVRFDFFSKAALEFLLQTQRQPDILHCHDWQTASVAKSFWDDYQPYGLWNPRVCGRPCVMMCDCVCVTVCVYAPKACAVGIMLPLASRHVPHNLQHTSAARTCSSPRPVPPRWCSRSTT